MEQFNLSEWLQDKSRKVITRDGRPVRIVCWDRQSSDDDRCIVGLVDNSVREDTMYFDKLGHYSTYSEAFCDLSFADEEPQSAEFSFGAFDSEFVKDEYLIPDGCEARIEGNKIIIERIQKKDELTEFEKEVERILDLCCNEIGETEVTEEWVKEDSAILLDLARKELQPEFDKEMDKILAETDKVVYQKGRQDALKDLPKWKYINQIQSGNHYAHIANGIISPSGYFISYDDLETLPKEE